MKININHIGIHVILLFFLFGWLNQANAQSGGCFQYDSAQTYHYVEQSAGSITFNYTLKDFSCQPIVGELIPNWITINNFLNGTIGTLTINYAVNQTSTEREAFIQLGTSVPVTDFVQIRIKQKKTCYKSWYPDQDNDGFGDHTSEPFASCTQPSGMVDNNYDLCPSEPNDLNNGCPYIYDHENYNWVVSQAYDITGKEIGASKSYFDDLGKPVQSQSLDTKTNKIWASQTIYDDQGRPALSTLSAPIGTDFGFKDDFIKKPDNSTFSSSDLGSFVADPAVVGSQPNTLGWYYSENNIDDPNTEEKEGETYQDITSRPYSRTIFSGLNPGTALKTIGGNKMGGEWKNGYVFSMPAGQELTQSKAFGDTKYDGNTYKIIKTVARDVHGVENVIFTDIDGRTLAAARSGNEEGNTVTRTSNVYIKEQKYVDIHLPAGTQGISITGSSGLTIYVYDLITEKIVHTAWENLPSGFYRIVVQNTHAYNPNSPITVTYKENYYDYSLNEYDNVGRLLSSYQPLNKLKSEFTYNALGQLEYTKSPDEGEAWFKYRKDGQIRYSQNSKQKAANQMSYTNYDSKGRPIESGVYKGFKPINFESLNPDGLGFPGSLSEQQFTTYDALTQEDINALPANYKDPSFLAGNVAKTQNENTTTYYNYDIYGRVQWIVQNINGLGVKTIDYEYDPVSSQVTQVIYQKYEAADRFIHRYTYDPKDYSLIKVETATDSDMPFTEHAAYEYYEKGGLKQLNLAEGLQKIDYIFNLNGALKSINHPNLDATSDPGRNDNDLFGMNLHYYQGDYARNPSLTKPNGIDQYNGNIKAMTWNTKGQNNSAPDTYYYTYDKNNWLTGASFNQAVNEVDPGVPPTLIKDEVIAATETAEATQSIKMRPGFKVTATNALTFTTNIAKDGTVQDDGDYNVSNITYDANGNIQSLHRNKHTDPEVSGGSNAMDKLSYSYDATKPNQLKQVIDEAGDVDGADDIDTQTNPDNYVYNEIGQLVNNKSENITYFYNASGLVTEVHKDNTPLVKFFYNDKNHRVRKESFNPTNSSITTTFYVRDASGTTMAVYNTFDANVPGGGSASPTITEHTIYGAQRLGVYKRYKNGGGNSLYQLTDHLGNVRAVIGRTVSGQEMAITSTTDYYPGGMVMPNRNLQGDYRYGYQGEYAETDPETGKPMFTLRMYDPRINRWLSPDPYGEFHSPYMAMGNNWPSTVDPSGGCTDCSKCPDTCGQMGIDVIPDGQSIDFDFDSGAFSLVNGVSSMLDEANLGTYHTVRLDGLLGQARFLMRPEDTMGDFWDRRNDAADRIVRGNKILMFGANVVLAMEGGIFASSTPATSGPRQYNYKGGLAPSSTPTGLDGNPQVMPRYIYRGGGTSPSDLKLRPGETHLSFSEGLANPTTGHRVFNKNTIIQIDVHKLPKGSITLDGGTNGFARGHVSVKATTEQIKAAMIQKLKVPKM